MEMPKLFPAIYVEESSSRIIISASQQQLIETDQQNAEITLDSNQKLECCCCCWSEMANSSRVFQAGIITLVYPDVSLWIQTR